MITDTQTIEVRCLRNATEFFIPDESGHPITRFRYGLMEDVAFDTTLPEVTIREPGKPFRVSTGGLVGQKLRYNDKTPFAMPSEVTIQIHVKYDHNVRRFFNPENGSEVHSAHFALLDCGLIIVGWKKES